MSTPPETHRQLDSIFADLKKCCTEYRQLVDKVAKPIPPNISERDYWTALAYGQLVDDYDRDNLSSRDRALGIQAGQLDAEIRKLLEDLESELILGSEKSARGRRTLAAYRDLTKSVAQDLNFAPHCAKKTLDDIVRLVSHVATAPATTTNAVTGEGPIEKRSNLGASPNFPKRAAWLKDRLHERSWNKHDPHRRSGPDHKTIQKILDGKKVREDVLEKLTKALSSQFDRVAAADIPQD